MNKYSIFAAAITAILLMSFFSCVQPQPNVPIYTFAPDFAPPVGNAPGTSVTPPLGAQRTPADQYVERNITVTDQNSTFSIGIPSGYIENTEVIAEKPLDYWFEYLPAEAKLEIDGKEIARDPTKWETKIAYTKSASKFTYRITNKTGQTISYNLHLIPSSPGTSIAVKINQRWIP